MSRFLNLVPMPLVLLGILAVGCGIWMELATREPVYLVIITAGSILIAVGIVCYGMKKDG